MSTKPREYCDVVMKGGITSGIVYPSAVLALAKRYAFKNIGGTSAGAIAAAALAAAALGERRRSLDPGHPHRDDESFGYSGLEQVSSQLQKPGFILSLFQPVAGTQHLFGSLLSFTGTRDLLARSLTAIRGILLTAPVTTLVAAAFLLWPTWVVGGAAGIILMLVPALVIALGLGAIVALRFLAQTMRSNCLGLCSGLRVGSAENLKEGLTDWLHGVLQAMAGQKPPLVFEDLWKAPRFADEPGTGALSLQMITTGVSHHEPRRLPFDNSRFWFRREQFQNLFPADVVDWMVAQDAAPLTIDGIIYHRLPEQGQLPVIVATRMSLSFPLLLSAVPLYEGVWKSASTKAAVAGPEGREARSLLESTDALASGGRRVARPPKEMRICWFSDGGIGSNFPVHLFDAPLPRWPTFAIDLVYPETADVKPTKAVFLPTSNNQGWQRRYASIAAPSAFSEIGSFLFGIIGTMQNWRDILQARAPGHRDRIVSIALAPDEGGMNLDMPENVVRRIAEKGERAGQLLADQFDFGNHWWIRWRNAASAVERFTIGFATAASATPTASYRDAYAAATKGDPPPPSYSFTIAQQQEAQHRFEQMVREGELWEDTVADLATGAPKPLPQLRIVPAF